MNNNFFKQKRWYIILLITSIVAILITVVLRIITPTTISLKKDEFIRTNNDGSQTRFNNISFSGEIPVLKDTLPIVDIQPSNTSIEYLKQQLIDNHNLKSVENIDGLWKGDNYSLSYNEQDQNYLFYYNFPVKDSLITDKNKAIKVANDYVDQTFSQLPLYLQQDQIRKLSGLNEFIAADYGAYNLLEIPFTYLVEDIPLYTEHSNHAPLTILINSEYKVQKVIFEPDFFFPVPRERFFKLISLGDALDNINNKQYASIISAYEKETGVFSLDEIVDGDLTSVQLEYRADLKNNIAYPFYHFSGELINQNNQKIQAEIIAPAIKIVE